MRIDVHTFVRAAIVAGLGLLVAAPRTAELGIVARALESLAASARSGDPSAALAQLSVLVPEFRPPSAPPRAKEDTHG